MPVVVLGTLALAGFVTVRRALDSTVDEADIEPAIDITVIESAVEENGLRAITETETLEAAINDDELDKEIDVQCLQSTVEEKLIAIEEAIDSGNIESILDAEELDAVTGRGLSTITEQEVIEGTVENGEIGVSIDMDELRSVLEDGTATLERTTTAVAETLDSQLTESMLDTGVDEVNGGTRIAVVDERGRLESLAGSESTTVDSQPQPIDIEDEDDSGT